MMNKEIDFESQDARKTVRKLVKICIKRRLGEMPDHLFIEELDSLALDVENYGLQEWNQ